MDTRFLGRGYGYETAAGQEAAREASAVGLTLDPTYTEKAFACALSLVRAETRVSEERRCPLLAHALERTHGPAPSPTAALKLRPKTPP